MPNPDVTVLRSSLDPEYVQGRPLTWWNKQQVELLSAMRVKAGEAMAFADSRLDFAMWTCKPCNGDERNVKEGASVKYDF